MTKAYTSNGTCEIEMECAINELCADTKVIIRQIYNSLKEENPELAELYKKYIIKSIETTFMSDEQMHEHLMKELLNVMLKGFEENELIQELKDLKKSENE